MAFFPRPRAPLLQLLLLFLAATATVKDADAARISRDGDRNVARGPATGEGDGDDGLRIDTVHVVFSNHLDMGFTDQDDAVINAYFHDHFPRAIALSDADPTFVFTTHAYLLSLFFDCPAKALALRCPSPQEVEALAAVISRGGLTWHAMPFNPQYETFFDAALLRFAVEGVAHRLDRRFGFPPKRVASLRDVPGMTRAAVPVLTRAGVVAVSAGVNGFSAPPGVPKNTPFLWRDPASNASLLYFVHPGGYGGHGRHDGCVTHRKSRLGLCYHWIGDNGGPPQNASEIQLVLSEVKAAFPEAGDVRASTLEAYVDGLMGEVQGWAGDEDDGAEGEAGNAGGGGDSTVAAASASVSSSSSSQSPPFAWPARFFPVVEDEIGDTWIHGIGSDVTRVADFRSALRARRAFCGDDDDGEGEQPPPGCSGADDPPPPPSPSDGDANGETGQDGDDGAAAVAAFSRFILKVPEHTWGVAFGVYFGGDFSNYTNAYLHPSIGFDLDGGRGGAALAPPPALKPDADLAPGYAAVVRSWRRQYGYLDAARAALPAGHPILEAWDADVAARAAMAEDAAFAERARAAVAARAAETVAAAAGAATEGKEQDGERASVIIPLVGADAPMDGIWRPIFVGGRRGGKAGDGGSDGDGDDDDCAPFPVRLVHWSFAFDRCTGGLASLRRRRWDAQGRELAPGAEWAGGGSSSGRGSSGGRDDGAAHFAELRYDVYGEEDYAPVWRDYAYIQPPWVGDFGKLNLTEGNDPARQRRRVGAVPSLVASFFRRDPPSLGGGSQVRLVLRFEDELVREAGAPREAWLDIREPGEPQTGADADATAEPPPTPPRLLITAVWRRKTPTRRPESLWLRFAPGPRSAADPDTWLLRKIATDISPARVALNGSHGMHAVADAGVSVRARPPPSWPIAIATGGQEVLRIASLDAALVAAGAPLPFPSPCVPPDMGQGVSFLLANNVWGTNYVMWVPWRKREVNAAFRFVLTSEREMEGAAAAGQSAAGAGITKQTAAW